MNTHTFLHQCRIFNISCGKDKGNLGGYKEKGVEKFFRTMLHVNH